AQLGALCISNLCATKPISNRSFIFKVPLQLLTGRDTLTAYFGDIFIPILRLIFLTKRLKPGEEFFLVFSLIPEARLQT
ncbi:hypothetical protein, partial [Acinetobacter sp. SM1B]|uniref:hypothetical protein n=1 Tax=Acinetobacter sp. SM1B TaxID=1497337 RepID=UPI001BC86D24